MNSILNYTQNKRNIGWYLATDHIGSVLVQCSRKWDRDHKQIQIADIASQLAADQLCKLNIAVGSGSVGDTKAAVLLGAGGKSCSMARDTTSRLASSRQSGENNQAGTCIVSEGCLTGLPNGMDRLSESHGSHLFSCENPYHARRFSAPERVHISQIQFCSFRRSLRPVTISHGR